MADMKDEVGVVVMGEAGADTGEAVPANMESNELVSW
jgi:hypothetical protein